MSGAPLKTRRRFVICEPWDVVVVPFPFTEKQGDKRRPAVVISNEVFNRSGHTLLAMITSQAHSPWPGDTVITNPGAAGLHTACMVRFKLFTLDNRLIIKTIGRLSEQDQAETSQQFRAHLF